MSATSATVRRLRHALAEAQAEESAGAHRWVVSYADFITLLFAFFVVMYSISSVNDGKFRVLSESMSTVFERPPLPSPIDLGGGMPGIAHTPGAETDGGPPTRLLEELAQDDFPVPVTDIDAHDVTAGELEKVLKDPIEQDHVRIRQTEDWIEVELDGAFAFASGQARLNAQAMPIIRRLAGMISATKTPVRIEGYTDDTPQRGGIYGSNWELSAARAGTVAATFAERGVLAERLAATGFGALHPVADNTSDDGRARNRRVVVAIARHPQVPGASVTLAAQPDSPEHLPADEFKHSATLPGPEEIR